MRAKMNHQRVAAAVMLGLLLTFLPNASFSQETITPQGAVIVQPPAPSSDLKVMTWNVAGGQCGTDRGMSPFADVIREHRPDVVAIQEIHRDQASRLASATGLHHDFVQTQDCRGEGPDFGIAVLSRYSFEGNSRKVYRLLPDAPSDRVREEFRKMLGVNIRVRGQLIRIYNTHLTAAGFPFGNNFREQQVKRILTRITQDQRNPGEDFWPILMGDFNLQPTSLTYLRLVRMFRDANRGENTTRDGRRIDYIFVGIRTGLKIDAAGALNTGALSDHFPVIARLSFK